MSQLAQPAEDIAIIGMAGRFPNAANIQEFWNYSCKGCKPDAGFYAHTDQLKRARLFDASFFGLSSQEKEETHPQQRTFLECASEALEDAGYAPEREDTLIGVFGNLSTHLAPDLAKAGGSDRGRAVYGLLPSISVKELPKLVAKALRLQGPGMCVETGPTSSLIAVALACQYLLTHQCDLALAGAVASKWEPTSDFIAGEGPRHFDNHARNSLGRSAIAPTGEEAGVIVLKRLPEALSEGDHIYAVVRGFASICGGGEDGDGNDSQETAQSVCIALAQEMAGITSEALGYIEVDDIISSPFSQGGLAELSRSLLQDTSIREFCALGSIREGMGEMDGAAGMAGLIRAALALHNKQIPPCACPAPFTLTFDLAQTPFYLNHALTEWKQGQAPRRAAVNASVAGTNAHIILEEAPTVESSGASRPFQILLLSAGDAAAMESASAELADFISHHADQNLADTAYTLQTGRHEFNHRRMVICRDNREAIEFLQTLNNEYVSTNNVLNGGAPSIVFMLPGRGMTQVNTGLELYEHESEFREHVDCCARMLTPHIGIDLRNVLFPVPEEATTARKQIEQPCIAQPALFIIEYALAKLWISWGVKPRAMIGHGLGEIVAAHLAGVLSLDDALIMAAVRGRIIQQSGDAATLAVQMSEPEIATHLNDSVHLAAINTRAECELCGSRSCLERLQQEFLERGIACELVENYYVSNGSDSKAAEEICLNMLKEMKLRPPRIPYLSSVTGDWIKPEQACDPMYWQEQLHSPIRFSEGLEKLHNQERCILLEVGPGRTLSIFASQHLTCGNELLPGSQQQGIEISQMETAGMLRTLGQLWLAGTEINWKGFYSQERRQRASLPTSPFKKQPLEAEAIESKPDFSSRPKASAPPLMQSTIQSPTKRNPFTSSIRVDKLESFDAFANRPVSKSGDSSPLPRTSQGKTSRPEESTFHARPEIDSEQDHLSGGKRMEPHSSAQPRVHSEHLQAAKRTESSKTLPLTEGQREIWYGVQRADGVSCAFIQSVMIQLQGELNVPVLLDTMEWLVERHEALRITFSPVGDVQFIHAAGPVQMPIMDLSPLSMEAQREQLSKLQRDAVTEQFDLVNGPMFRMRLIKLGPETHTLLLAVHHLICDGSSLGILLQELGERYSFQATAQSDPCETPLGFGKFIMDQEITRQGPSRARAEAFWLEQYSGGAPVMELPADFVRPKKRNFMGGSQSMPLDGSLCQALKDLSKKQRCTLFTTVLAGYYLLLHRLTGQAEIVVGLPMTSRSGKSEERLVGHCVNFLPLRLNIEGNPVLSEYLGQVRNLMLSAHEHQNYTLGSLLQKLNLPRESNRMPLVSVMFNLNWVREVLALEGLDTKVAPNPYCYSQFDVSFSLTECQGQLEMDCHYSAELFKAETIQRWFNHFATLLLEMTRHPDRRIGQLSVLSITEQKELVQDWRPSSETIESLPQTQQPNLQHALGRIDLNAVAGFYVLDGYGELCPIGVRGELFIGCSEEARLGIQPQSEQVKCLPNPIQQDQSDRVYSTGLRARYLPGGELDILGRMDQEVQAQLNGHRVDLARLKLALEEHPAVSESFSLVQKGTNSQDCIVSYVVGRSSSSITANDLRSFLQSRLPALMVPTGFVFLQTLPLTTTGKVDCDALPKVEFNRSEEPAKLAAPFSPTEQKLASIWCEVIALTEIGRDDNFFDLGGHSVLLTQVITRVRKEFGVELTLRHMFESPTIGELASVIDAQLIQPVQEGKVTAQLE
ncbi:type I polyketide synthase [Pedosphaera parvula]|uniref:Condensation domain protein n=1 Tax=Pedosphaera parvula (strain Ellin514) TaxID=320771 RepID=B9XAN6_PEDPL|nr:type I polyketide synthase [Pedosphaera parvula]EEF63071.1 condensation domain protein [Pedosphaera parvula Ellin514]